jgi:hypothetical protein
MKTIAFITCLVSTVFLNFYNKASHYEKLSEIRLKQIDSLKILMYDVQRDSVVNRMLTDFGYRTKVNTLVRIIPDSEIVKLINKYKCSRQKPVKNQMLTKNSSKRKLKAG